MIKFYLLYLVDWEAIHFEVKGKRNADTSYINTFANRSTNVPLINPEVHF